MTDSFNDSPSADLGFNCPATDMLFKKKRSLTAYNRFVKAHWNKVTALTAQKKMKAIAKLWREKKKCSKKHSKTSVKKCSKKHSKKVSKKKSKKSCK